jgi:WD40 repeat protein
MILEVSVESIELMVIGDLNSPQSVVAHSKSVHGVCFDPFNDDVLATFSEDGNIRLWDIRNFVDPVCIYLQTSLTF